MTYIKWGFWLVVWLGFGTVMEYSLPQYDVVRIVDTFEKRQDINDWTRIFWSDPDDLTTTLNNRDVQFIQAVFPDGKAMVYRNEDTGWSWPPYFKFDTANLYTEASDLVSTRENPQWVSIMHYGWRNQFFSIFPNAVDIEPVDGPDDQPFNWVTYSFFTFFAIGVALLWRCWVLFRRRHIDPVVDDVEDSFHSAGDAVTTRWQRFRRWLDTWKSRSP
ncbi:DUF1523 family protein [Halomonas denitrificans]|uniref:DUF1523 family protein n=1 Tax=Halomonas denitrificans TaxID=370769 RepID=UPI001C9906FC|nr:DUF1523 family protein [Halomonas denitrificans]MBY5969937.1 DUF1523 family protein [Halomonas denitrificans]